jgi:hypothetical protein
MSDYKVTVTLPNGTLKTYVSKGSVPTETDDLKTFTGHRDGETTEGLMTIHKDKIVDQKVEPLTAP